MSLLRQINEFCFSIFLFSIVWGAYILLIGEMRFQMAFPDGHWMLFVYRYFGLPIGFVVRNGIYIPFLIGVGFTLKLSRYGTGNIEKSILSLILAIFLYFISIAVDWASVNFFEGQIPQDVRISQFNIYIAVFGLAGSIFTFFYFLLNKILGEKHGNT